MTSPAKPSPQATETTLENPKPAQPRPRRLLSNTQIVDLSSHLMSGGSMNTWCRDNGIEPSLVYRTMKRDDGLRQEIQQAQQDGVDALVDEMLDISRLAEAGLMPPDAARVAVQTRQWIAGKLKPGKYSDKQQLNIEVRQHKQTMLEHLQATLTANQHLLPQPMQDKEPGI